MRLKRFGTRSGSLARRLGGSLLVVAAGFLLPFTASADTTIKFMAWNFQVETVQEFLKQFEAENPGIKVDAEFIPSAQYAAKLALMHNANTPFDALYVFDHVLGSWSSWLEPLDGYEGAAELKAKMLPLARQSMTYNGNHPRVHRVAQEYVRGVRRSVAQMKQLETLVNRLPGLENSFIDGEVRRRKAAERSR